MTLRRFSSIFFAIVVSCLSSFSTASALDFDTDGDGKDDLILFDAASASFVIRRSSNGLFRTLVLGERGGVPVTGDFNNDGISDLATFIRTTRTWDIHRSGASEVAVRFGKAGSFPVPADYRGSNCTDLATYSPTTSTWRLGNCLSTSGAQILRFGKVGDIPTPADFDGDGKADVAVFRPTQTPGFRIRKSSNLQVQTINFGLHGDIPVPADYTGDGKADVAVYRPSNNKLYYRKSEDGSGPIEKQWGLNGDHFVGIDFDGDGEVDRAVYRPSTNSWFVQTAAGPEHEISWVKSKPSDDVLASQGFPLTLSRGLSIHVDGDYTGDGRTDFAAIDSSTGFASWKISNLRGSTKTLVFGLSTDTLRAGDTDGDASFEPIVFRPGALFGYWYAYRVGADARLVSWGLASDYPLLGDFDCDGRDDFAVVRSAGVHKYWYIRASSGDATIGVPFGAENDSVFAADTDGDHCDEMVIARSDDATGFVSWYSRNVQTSRVNRVNWGLVGDELLPPVDYNGDRRDDFIVTRDVAGTKTAFVRLNSANDRTPITVALQDGDTIPGMYSGLVRAELATHSSEEVGEVNVVLHTGTGSAASVEESSGDVVMMPAGLPLGGSSSGGGGNLSSVCPTVVGVSSGFLWKPESDHSGYPRVGRPLAIFKSNTPRESCLKIYDSQGNQVSQIGVYEYSGKYGGRWYTGFGCGDLKYGGEIASAAESNTGSDDVYIERGNGVCVGPINPRSRNGSL